MNKLRLLATSLLVALGAGFSSCGDEITTEVIQQEPDNTLELLIGSWVGTGDEEGEILTFNSDNTFKEEDGEYVKSGTFEYFPYRYMFITNFQTDWGSEDNIIYTVVKVTEDELILNDNGHSDVEIYNRKK